MPVGIELQSRIESALRTRRELNALCTQNGWIDTDTIRYEVVAATPSEATVAVTFEEIVMEGAGCVADRVPCGGRLRFVFDPSGVLLELAPI